MWFLSVWTCPSEASRWNGASFRSVERRHRPAVLPVGGDELADVLLPASALGPRPARALLRSSPLSRSAACASAATARGSDACPAAPTAAYWVLSSSCALADHGISSQSRQTQSSPASSQKSAAVRAARTRSRNCASSAGVVEEPPAGAGGRRCRSRLRARRTAPAPPARPGRR